MGKQVRILAISGSMRKASFNSKILRIAANAAQAAGADVTFLDLRELNFLSVFANAQHHGKSMYPEVST